MRFEKSILAGVFIGIGGAVCSLCADKHIGAFMFGVGLYLVCVIGADLYTGKVGYLSENANLAYIRYLVFVWAGNLTGAACFGWLMRIAKPELVPMATDTVVMRLGQPAYTTFVLAFFCGMLVHCAVYIYKTTGRLIGIFICVPAFILCGFEHCVADMYIFALAEVLTPVHLLVVTLGNTAGAIAANFVVPARPHPRRVDNFNPGKATEFEDRNKL